MADAQENPTGYWYSVEDNSCYTEEHYEHLKRMNKAKPAIKLVAAIAYWYYKNKCKDLEKQIRTNVCKKCHNDSRTIRFVIALEILFNILLIVLLIVSIVN